MEGLMCYKSKANITIRETPIMREVWMRAVTIEATPILVKNHLRLLQCIRRLGLVEWLIIKTKGALLIL